MGSKTISLGKRILRTEYSSDDEESWKNFNGSLYFDEFRSHNKGTGLCRDIVADGGDFEIPSAQTYKGYGSENYIEPAADTAKVKVCLLPAVRVQ